MASLKDQIAIKCIDTDCYQSIVPPIHMGDSGNRAYGGNILVIAVNAAYATIETGQHLYSISDFFVRSASSSHNLICRVKPIRDTCTFQTRHLGVVQFDGISEKLCLIATADFHIDEPTAMANYSARPKLPISSTPVEETAMERTQESGLYTILNRMMAVHHTVAAGMEKTFRISFRLSDSGFMEPFNLKLSKWLPMRSIWTVDSRIFR